MSLYNELEQEGNDDFHRLSNEEVENLRKELKDKWQDLTTKYQAKAHQRIYNSEWEKKRREGHEREIAHVES